ncbi:MAG: EAL domain-containing protein [Acidimicrobiales bacterium]|jgi:diguanylate cyclase (GGDEF)-like protein/PAS domain S-box-containing protein
MNVGDRRLARLLDAFPEIVVVLDAMGNVLWANHLAEVLFDRSLEDAIGMSGIDLVHPDDLEIVLRSLETVQSKSVGSPLEIRAKVGDDWRLIELIGTPVPWFEKGAVLFSIRDLTDRRRFELARDNVARFRSLVHNATTIMMFVSPTGDVESVSGAMTRMLGHDPETVERQPLANIVAPADRPALRVAIETALRSSSATQPVVQALRLLRRGGDEMISYELSIVSLVDDPTVGGLVVTAHDVSARVTAEMELRNTVRELRETSSLLNATLESTADGLLVVGTDRTITSFNSQFAEMWRLPTNLVAARDDHRLLEYVAGQLVDPDAFMSRVLDLYAQPEVESDDTLEFIDGRVFQRLSKPQYVSGDVVGRVWSFSDITEQKRLENDLAHLAFHDALTGLANRALFHDRVNQALARVERSDNYVAVLILDLDNFKTINDSLGHSAGDELLNNVASTLVGSLRKSDTAARLGGDEFAVLIEDAPNRDEIMRMADRLMKTLRAPVTVAGQELNVTVSMGITFGISGNTGDQLLRNADLAMYLAKAQGKDRIEEFQDQMHVAVVQRLELENDLRRAVLSEELRVHYQPIINLVSGVIVGFEALVRWQHPTQGLLQPRSFVPFAEEIGFIQNIDRYVLTEACTQARHWQSLGLAPAGLLMSVNLSAREISDSAIRESVSLSLLETGFEPRHLILEITESALLRDLDATIRNLESLKSLGLSIAVDDFGTGFSSFSHLEQLPIDILKVDRSFVANITTPDGRPSLAPAIVQLAHTLGLTAIAEGVESPDQVTPLRDIECMLAQGYHLGVPLSASETEGLLRSRAS